MLETNENLNARIFRLQSRYVVFLAFLVVVVAPPTANAQSILWDTYLTDADDAYKANRFGEAEKLYKLALVEAEKFDSSDARLATNLNNLGLLYVNWKRFDQAEPLIKRALAIRERTLGSDHVDTASCMAIMALLLSGQDKYEQAEVLYKRVLEIREKAVSN